MSVLKINQSGPFVSVQDSGRAGLMRFGVTRSGPIDRTAYQILQAALEGGENFSAIEVSLGGLTLTATGPLTLGFVGGDFSVSLDRVPLPAWSVFTMETGQTLTIRSGPSGSWGYLGVCGQIDSPEWLGSRATHLTTGLCGRVIKSGDVITIHNATARRDLHAALPIPDFAGFDGKIRVVLGPQDQHFSQAVIDALTSEFTITPDYDRMGMRLSGPSLHPEQALSIPSEALVRGSVQVPGHGDPIILLAEHQTTGGYPKIATVITADQDRLTQARSGMKLRLEIVDVNTAIKATRTHADQVDAYIQTLSDWRGSLEDRLNRLNLISGVITDSPD